MTTSSTHSPALVYPREMLAQRFAGSDDGPSLDMRETVFTLVDAVFFASMMLEEGHQVRIAIVHVEGGADELATVRSATVSDVQHAEAQLAWDVTRIAPLRFDPHALAKLSPGLKYGTHLVVVGGRAPNLRIDGIARRIPRTDGGEVVRLAAPRPGVVVFERQDRELLRFDAGRSLRPSVDVMTDECPVRALVGAITHDPGSGPSYSGAEWALIRLINKMRATGHGGILALSPTEPPESVLSTVRYRRADAHLLPNRIREEREATLAWSSLWAGLGDQPISPAQLREGGARRVARDNAREALEAAVEDIAQLSAIDLAVLIGPGLAVFGAGFHIRGSQVMPVKALDAEGATRIPMLHGYGARHHAGFSFAHDNPGGVAFVVSVDGPVSCATRIDDHVLVWRVHVSET